MLRVSETATVTVLATGALGAVDEQSAATAMVLATATGIAGTVFVALPFLNEAKWRELVHELSLPRAGNPAAARVLNRAAATAEQEVQRYDPRDRRSVLRGLVLIALSYFFGLQAFLLTP